MWCGRERDVNTRPGRTAARQPGGRFCTTTRLPSNRGRRRANRGGTPSFSPLTSQQSDSVLSLRPPECPFGGGRDRRGAAWPGPMMSMFFAAALPGLQEARDETADCRFRGSNCTFLGFHWALGIGPRGCNINPIGLTPLLGRRCDLEKPVHSLLLQRPLSHPGRMDGSQLNRGSISWYWNLKPSPSAEP